MELQVSAFGGSKASAVKVPEDLFAVDFNEALVHQVVVATLAASRQGTKAQKTRSEVRGGGAKPWRQKGTGRARAGTNCSPIWRTGGVTFAAKPRSFKQKVNKKMYRGAVRSILSELIRQNRLLLVENIDVDVPKTRELVTLLKTAELEDVLIVHHDISENLFLASRNLYKVGVCDASQVDPAVLMAYDKVLMTVEAVKHFEETLA